jgi:hypothetical protein
MSRDHAAVSRLPPQRRGRSDGAVADIIASILMIAVTVVMMGAVFTMVLSVPGPEDRVHADIAVRVDPGFSDPGWGTGDEAIVVEHHGGEPLDQGSTVLKVNLDGQQFTYDGARLSALGVTFPFGLGGRMNISQTESGQPLTIFSTSNVEVNVVGGGSIVAGGGVNIQPPGVTIVPGAPVLTSAVRGDGRVNLTWTEPSAGSSPIQGYRVYVGNASGGEAFSQQVGGTSAAVTGLTNGVTYYFQVTAFNGAGEGPRSNELSAKPAKVPNAPTGFVGQRGNGEALLTWVASVDNGDPVVNYTIKRFDRLLAATTVIDTVGNVTTFADTGLVNGNTYSYNVTAWNAVGQGPSASPYVVVTPAILPGQPVVTAARGNGTVTLSWPPPDSGGPPITAYSVYRGTVSGAEVFILNTTSPYNNTGLTNGVVYYYQVTAWNVVGEGPRSNETSATPAAAPDAPVDLSASAGNAQVTLTWTRPPSHGDNITGYKLYRGTTPNGEGATVYKNIAGGNTSDVDGAASNCQTWYYKLVATNTVGDSAFSPEVSATPPGTLPGQPTGLAGVSQGTGNSLKIHLSWTAPATSGGCSITYQVYKCGPNSNGCAPASPAFATSTVTTYDDSSVTNGKKYCYQVSAKTVVGEGTWSSPAVCVTA